MRKRLLFSICVLLLISACSSVPEIINPDGLPADQLAWLHPEKARAPDDILDIQLTPRMHKIQSIKGERLSKYPWMRIRGVNAYALPPGRYVVTVRCTKGSAYALVTEEFKLDAGGQYFYTCKPITSKNLFGETVTWRTRLVYWRDDYRPDPRTVLKERSVNPGNAVGF